MSCPTVKAFARSAAALSCESAPVWIRAADRSAPVVASTRARTPGSGATPPPLSSVTLRVAGTLPGAGRSPNEDPALWVRLRLPGVTRPLRRSSSS